MKKAAFVPPYTSAGEFVRFITSIRSRRPNPLTLKSLQEIGINQSNAYTLFGTLKAMGLYDEKGTLLQVDDLNGLASKDEGIKRDSFKKIVIRTYEDLIARIPLEEATVEKVRHYFVVNGAAPSIALKAARLFIWLANQAGYATAEVEFVPYKLEQEKPQKPKQNKKKKLDTNGSRNNTASEANVITTSRPADYEEWLLNILLEKMSATNELPSADVLKQVRELIEAHKLKNKTHQPESANEPESQKQTLNAE